MKPERAWVRLQSGGRLNLLSPDPFSWTDRDLAIGLARTYRWGGHSRWARPLSVAQHSILVLALRQRRSPDRTLTPAEMRRELLHDADEGMLSFDPIAPLKPHLGPDYGELVARLRVALAERYRIPEWDHESYEAHKAADQVAAASEAMHVAGWSEKELTDTLGITRAPVIRDPLASPRGYLAWEPWLADDAADRFLMVLEGLLGPADLSPVLSPTRGQAA
jgi:hypothetical protein